MDHIFSSKRSCFPGCAAEWTQTSNALASNLCILSVFSLFIFIKTILGINISIIHKASPSADSADKDFPLSLFSASVNLMGTGATPPKVILKSARFPDVPKKAYAKVISCLQCAQIWEDVEKMPDGIDTLVGQNGTTVSGGQRQRIALARALYKDFEILIMDEATAALDIETEKAVIDSIRQMKGNKTLLMVTHHLSLADECEHVYRIENQKLVKVR